MLNENCIFCKIIKGDLKSFKIYEDDDFLAILDINPVSKGHTLLMPKQHYSVMPQMPIPLIAKMGSVIKLISKVMLQMLSAKGTLIYIANGAAAGQTAPHFMVHIIPKYENEEPLLKDNESMIIDPSQFKQVNEDLKKIIFSILNIKPLNNTKVNKNIDNSDLNKSKTNKDQPSIDIDYDKIREIFEK